MPHRYFGFCHPCAAGGYLRNVSESVVTLWLPQAGHHVDLYRDNPTDLPAWRQVRAQEKSLLTRWLREAAAAAAAGKDSAGGGSP